MPETTGILPYIAEALILLVLLFVMFLGIKRMSGRRKHHCMQVRNLKFAWYDDQKELYGKVKVKLPR